MFLKRTLAVVGIGACLALGCSNAAGGGETATEGQLQQFQYEPLAKVTPEAQLDAYRAAIAPQIAEAKSRHPEIESVGAADLTSFTYSMQLLEGLRLYFRTTGSDRVATAEIEAKLVALMTPALEGASTGGFVDASKLTREFSDALGASIDDARYEAALKGAKAPRGVNLRATFDKQKAKWGHQGVYLPTKVSGSPSPEQLLSMFNTHFHDDPWAQGPADVLEELESEGAFDKDILADVIGQLKSPGSSIKDAWYFKDSGGSSEEFYLFFLDENQQVWGFDVFFDYQL
jgi:hypothetical protein